MLIIKKPEQTLNDGAYEYFVQTLQNPMEELLIAHTRTVCEKSRIQFLKLSTIQRKFVTHYRCGQCGLLPLYYLDLEHIKRVRCRKCGELVAFKKKGKFGKLRKEIAIELWIRNKGESIFAKR